MLSTHYYYSLRFYKLLYEYNSGRDLRVRFGRQERWNVAKNYIYYECQ